MASFGMIKASKLKSRPKFSHHNSRIDFGSLIYEASKQKDAEGLELILSQSGAPYYVNTAGRDGLTPLTYAAMNGDLSCTKILLANKCNLHLKGSLNGKEKFAWELAEEFNHAKVAKYLNGCVDDLVSFQYHRAMMEADVIEICSANVLTKNDIKEFHKHMERLILMDTFCIDGDEFMPSLLVLAAEADNKLIVEELLEKYNATPYANNQQGDTALHLACRTKSDLRYYLTKRTPQLLFSVNVDGIQPLHIACQGNDLEYYIWIFQSVLDHIERLKNSRTDSNSNILSSSRILPPGDVTAIAGDDSDSRPTSQTQLIESQCDIEVSVLSQKSLSESFLETTSHMLKQTCTAYGNSPLTIDDVLSLHMRLFAVDIHGRCILHMAAKNGYSELLHLVLEVAKVLEHSPDGIDLEILTKRDASITPVEQAIESHEVVCLKLLLDFASQTPVINRHVNDEALFTVAVSKGTRETLEVLLEYGIFKGLERAIHKAELENKYDLLRMLLFYYTQISSLQSSFYGHHKQVSNPEKSVVSWEQLNLQEVDKDWLTDSKIAIASALHTLSDDEYNSLTSYENIKLLSKLGKDCVQYFKVYIWQPHACPRPWQAYSITELTLSGNQLHTVPPEVFQIETLLSLDLSQNKLSSLPSSLDVQNPIYTCHSLTRLSLNNNSLQTLPEDFFFAFGNSLKELRASDNLISVLPPGLWVCPKLHTLVLAQNKLSQLHYFSDRKFYFDEEFSQILINGITIQNGVPVNSGNLDDEQFMNMINYVTRLNIFYQTVKVLLPDIADESSGKHRDDNLLQHVVDIHWLRLKLSSDKRSSVTCTFDVSLSSDEHCSIKSLDLSHNEFTKLPWNLACIASNLEKLDMRGNRLKSLSFVKDLPANIESVILSDNVIQSVLETHPSNPCGCSINLLSGYVADPRLVGKCKHTAHNILSKVTNINLNCNELTEFPCVQKPTDPSKYLRRTKSLDGNLYHPLFPNLSVISLDQNNLQAVPQGIQCLTQLSSLSLNYNVSITRLPLEMGTMNPQILLVVKLEGVYPKNVNPELLKKPGARSLLTYLKMLHQKSVPYYRLKLMIIGNSNMGKTSLLLNLTSKGKVTRFKEVEKGVNKVPLSTVGVDLGDWEYQLPKRPKVTFMTWDFGGQEEYYATHQCFLTQRSLYVLVWNVEMNEAGLASLKPWLENIGGRVPGAPVVVVGTHIDSIPLQKRPTVLKHFNLVFKKMYLDHNISPAAYPSVYKKCFFVSSYDGTNINNFRDELYEFALSIKPTGRRYGDCESLVKQHVPDCYIKLQDRVRDIARRCAKDKRHPVLTTEEMKHEAFSGNYFNNIDELEQGIQFLHENGILLHYDDPALSDLYFVDPQWLCSILACVVTVYEKNPFQKNGFMEFNALKLLLKDNTFPQSLVKEFLSLMQKFEVAHILNDKSILIPSLLPSSESNACILFSSLTGNAIHGTTNTLQASIMLHVPMFTRYYLLPFIPNGFFPRLLARIMGSEVSEVFSECIENESDLCWRFWRNGIIMIVKNIEVFRVSPIHLPITNTDDVIMISSTKNHEVLPKDLSTVQVVVSVLPETVITCRSSSLSFNDSKKPNFHIAIWMLRKLIDIINSVFDDWYDAFARINGFDSEAVQQASPCMKCLQQTMMHSNSEVSISTLTSQLSSYISSQRIVHLFTSPFCVLVASKNEYLSCPLHGPIRVSDIAPDLAFADFSNDKLFYEPDAVITKLGSLGVGGFGSVHNAILENKNQKVKVAVKEFLGVSGKRELEGEEAFFWDTYLSGSKEARMMNHLRHPNILALIGIAFDPLRLVLELAPKGDLKEAIEPFRKAQRKLNRGVLKVLMYQVADAMDYIHSRNVIYRDMKPGNILVWEFPHPKSESNNDDVSVLVKLADYGISKYCTPEGVRGSEGTPAYLPPEVVLHGGSTSYSTKLDVYSYGMVLYYLFTFLGPFENEKGRPVSALLDEGKRPELSANNRPLAIQMYELMCWCWSEKPINRPTFAQIKALIKKSTFVHLTGSSALLDDDVFTAVCVQSFKFSNSTHKNADNISLSTVAPSPSAISLFAASTTQESSTKVWYGTKKGRLCYVQFPSKNGAMVIHNFKQSVTCICSYGSQVWVGTKAEGIVVYENDNIIATWSSNDIFYHLLYVTQSKCVVALGSGGLIVFEVLDDNLISKRMLNPIRIYSVEAVLVSGLAISRSPNTELWCCSNSGQLKIFELVDTNIFEVKSFTIPKADHHLLQYFNSIDQTIVVISMGNLFQLWSLSSRKQMSAPWDTHKVCCTNYGPNVRNSYITSLLVEKETFYIGTRGGLIILFNHVSHKFTHLLEGYNSSVSFLVSIDYCPIKKLNRYYSHATSAENVPTSNRSSVSSLFDSTMSSFSLSNQEHYIVLSFGNDYCGIASNAKNFPEVFLPPSDKSLSCSCCFLLPGMKCMCNLIKERHTKSLPGTGFMLCWLNEDIQ